MPGFSVLKNLLGSPALRGCSDALKSLVPGRIPSSAEELGMQLGEGR